MMKTTLIKSATLFLTASFLLASCKKDTQLLGNKDSLSHPWKLQQQGSDVNGNEAFDANEKNAVAESAKLTYQFKNDGTGFIVGVNNVSVDTFSWELINNESVIHMAINSKGFINNLYYHYEYSPKTLVLRDTTVKPSYFRYLERQD